MERTTLNPASKRAQLATYRPKANRVYFDVGIGSVCLAGADTGGAFCLLEMALAPGMGVPLHMHTREDESYFVLRGALEVTVGMETFVLRPGDALLAPRGISHQLRNPGSVENHYLLVFSPSGFEGFLKATAIPAPANAPAPTLPSAVAIRNVQELATEYGIEFGG